MYDRDPAPFAGILDAMRHARQRVPIRNRTQRAALRRELFFYSLQDHLEPIVYARSVGVLDRGCAGNTHASC